MKVFSPYHQADFKKVGCYTHEYVDLPEHVEIEGSHPVVVCDTGEKVHQDELTVSLSSVPRFLLRRSLSFCTTLHDDYRGRPATRDSYKVRLDDIQEMMASTHCSVQHKPLPYYLLLRQRPPPYNS